MQKLIALIAISIILSQAYAQNSCGPGAATCQATSNTTYLTCLSGWYSTPLTGGTVGCSACPSRSLTCTSGVNALTCRTGNQLENGFCIACQITMTAACQSTCTTSGLITVGSTCVSCLSTTAPCATGCSTQGFYSSGNSCQQCPLGSTACSSATLSSACSESYYLGAGGVCTACPAGQASCSVSPVATSCNSGYFLSATNVCTQCAASTTSACQAACLTAGFYTSGTTCLACASSTSVACNAGCLSQGWYTGTVTTTSTGANPTTTTVNSCNQCGTGQTTCQQVSTTSASPSIATGCSSNYYLAATGICTLCSSVPSGNQLTCTSSVVPSTCSQGFFVNQTSCVACLSQVASCSDSCKSTGFYTVNSTCLQCATGASTCVDNTNATQCQTGFYLLNVTCVAVSTGTVSTNNPVSTECLPGYFKTPVNGQDACALCQVGAKTCSSATQATECLAGYVINALKDKNACVPCQVGAATCTTLAALSCNSGRYLSQTMTCIDCSDTTNAETCSSNSATAHLGCVGGYFLNSGTCTACTNNAFQCISTAIHTKCLATFYAVAPYTTTTQCLTYNNAFTTKANAGPQAELSDRTASACASGYFLTTSTATPPVSTCTLCTQASGSSPLSLANSVEKCASATAIETCKSGYILYQGVCAQCAGSNVAACTVNTANAANVKCHDGFYLSDIRTCTTCGSNVKTCSGTFTSGEVGTTPVISNMVCLDGFVLTAANTCTSCNDITLNSISKCTDGTTPAACIGTQITAEVDRGGIATCGITGTTYTIITSLTCKPGYLLLTKQGDSTKLLGCQKCSATATDTAVQTAAAYVSCAATTMPSTVAAATLTSAVCQPGYFLTDAKTCKPCKSATELKQGDNTNAPKGQAGIKTCTTSNFVLMNSVTCDDGYFVTLKSSVATDPIGCTICEAAKSANYKSCTFPTIPTAWNTDASGTITSITCATNYVLSTVSTCRKCDDSTDNAVLKAGDSSTAILNMNKIASCGITGTSYNTITSITCIAGYLITNLASDATKIVGCTPCENDANRLFYKSCSGTMPSAYNTAATITAAVCNDGYFLSDAKTCKACSSTSTLKAADGTSTIFAQAALLTCDGGSAFTTLQSTYTCKAGFVKLSFTYTSGGSSVTGAAGCIKCDRTLTAENTADYSPNPYSSCVAPHVGQVTTATNTITPVYGMQSDLFTITTCAAGFFVRNNACGGANGGTCDTGADQCTSATKATSCKSNYVLIGDSCTQCSANAITCSPSWTVAVTPSSGYVIIQGQAFACPANALTCRDSLVPSTCSSGYFVKDGACSACGDGADTCSSNTVAINCKSGFWKSTSGQSTTCAACTNNALVCASATTATSCKDNWYVNAQNTCTQCGTGASTCTASGATKCQSGFYLDTTCKACAPGVDECTSTAATKCLSGFFLSSGSCSVCPRNAATCTSYTAISTCVTGYSLVGSACIVCENGASTCSSTSVAITCLTGYYLQLGACLKCSDNAATCASSTYALTCFTTTTGQGLSYYLSSGTCVACGAGAATCDSSKALTCGSGYVLLTGGTSCTQCSTGASTCTSATEATACSNGFYLANKACVACGTGIATCSSATTITLCATGYSSVTSGSTTSCVQCPSNAATCSSTTVATGCNSGYTVSSGSCVPCLPGTKTCNAPQSTACQSGFVVNANGACTACASTTAACFSSCLTASPVAFASVGNTCVACPASNTGCTAADKASGCRDGFFLSNQVCTACPTGARTCSSATVITACLTVGYFQATTNSIISCTMCGTGVNECLSATTAKSCQSGFYLTEVNTCKQCTAGANIATCSLLGSANTCASTYYPLNGVCLSCAVSTTCPSQCTKLGFFNSLNSATNATSCVACSSNALSCSSATVATSCASGFYLSGAAACVACASNTAQCDLKTTQTACAVGWSLVNGACTQCPANFATCTNATFGLTCMPYYYYVDNKTCTACPSPSYRCSSATSFQSCLPTFYKVPVQGQDVSCSPCGTANNVVNCYNLTWALTCSQGFSPVNGSCTACPANAQSCSGSLINQCLPGYFIVNRYFANNTCNACGVGAATCSSNTTALTCLTGYGLSSSGTCVKCGTGASSCSVSGTSTTATACYASFQNVTNGACSCAAGQAPSADGTSCAQCPANCAVCSSPTQCTTCNTPYAVSSSGACAPNCAANQYFGVVAATNSTTKRVLQSSCQNCPNTCSACTSATSCTNCTQGNSIKSDNTCGPSFAQKLSLGNILMMMVLFLGFAIIIKQ